MISLSGSRLSKTTLLWSSICLLFPSSGYDVYAFISSYSSYTSFYPGAPRLLFGILIPKYFLLEPLFLSLSGFGLLPALLPAFIFIYFSLYHVSRWSININHAFLVRALICCLLVFNTLSISATGISINFILIYFLNPRKNLLFLLLATFLSPLGFVSGSLLLLVYLLFNKPSRFFAIFWYFLLFSLSSLFAQFSLASHPVALSSPYNNIDLSSIAFVLEIKATEIFLVSILLLLILAVTFVQKLSLRFKGINIGIKKFLLIFTFFAAAVLPLNIMSPNSAKTSMRPVEFAVKSLNHSDYSTAYRTHEVLFCAAFISSRICEYAGLHVHSMKHDRLSVHN